MARARSWTGKKFMRAGLAKKMCVEGHPTETTTAPLQHWW